MLSDISRPTLSSTTRMRPTWFISGLCCLMFLVGAISPALCIAQPGAEGEADGSVPAARSMQPDEVVQKQLPANATPVVAVLDFESSTLDPGQEEAFTQAIWSEFYRDSKVRVLDRKEVRHYLIRYDLHPDTPFGPPVSLGQAAGALQADYIASGHVNATGGVYTLDYTLYSAKLGDVLAKDSVVAPGELMDLMLNIPVLAEAIISAISSAENPTGNGAAAEPSKAERLQEFRRRTLAPKDLPRKESKAPETKQPAKKVASAVIHRVDTHDAEPAPEAAQPEPAHDEPVHDEPAHDEPAHPEPAHDEPAHDEPAHHEPAHEAAAHDEPAHHEPAHEAAAEPEASVAHPDAHEMPPPEPPHAAPEHATPEPPVEDHATEAHAAEAPAEEAHSTDDPDAAPEHAPEPAVDEPVAESHAPESHAPDPEPHAEETHAPEPPHAPEHEPSHEPAPESTPPPAEHHAEEAHAPEAPPAEHAEPVAAPTTEVSENAREAARVAFEQSKSLPANDLSGRIDLLRKSTVLDPTVGSYRTALALAYYNVGDYAKSAEQCKAAARLMPEDSMVQTILGSAYFESKHYDEARAAHEKAIHLDPNNLYSRYNLALTLQAQGSPKALGAWEEFLSHSEGHADQAGNRVQAQEFYDDLKAKGG